MLYKKKQKNKQKQQAILHDTINPTVSPRLFINA